MPDSDTGEFIGDFCSFNGDFGYLSGDSLDSSSEKYNKSIEIRCSCNDFYAIIVDVILSFASTLSLLLLPLAQYVQSPSSPEV